MAAVDALRDGYTRYAVARSDQPIVETALDASDVVYFDDFGSTSTNWWQGTWGGCSAEYAVSGDGFTVYRLTVSGNGNRCIIYNGYVPWQNNGTFEVKLRRTTSDSNLLRYGFVLGGADLYIDSWALQAHPFNETHSGAKCYGKPYYWLFAVEGNEPKYFEDECTDEIDNEEDDWNVLKVVRSGSTIHVFINGVRI